MPSLTEGKQSLQHNVRAEDLIGRLEDSKRLSYLEALENKRCLHSVTAAEALASGSCC